MAISCIEMAMAHLEQFIAESVVFLFINKFDRS